MATKKADVVMLENVEFKALEVRIKGTSPLVTNPMSLKAIAKIEDKQKGASKTKGHDIRNPMEDFISSLYWLTTPPKEYTEQAFEEAINNGARFGFHVGGLKNSAMQAAYRRNIVKNLVTARGLFRIAGTQTDMIYSKECIEILTDEPPIMRKDCLSTFNSGADMRYRAQFNNWRMKFIIEYDAGMITPDQLLTWFRLGGFACGLGENRVEKGDGWGSYDLDM